jgi:hypothetical protein
MSQVLQKAIVIGDRVRSYLLPGVSTSDFITGVVIGTSVLAGLPRFVIRAQALTIHGQEDVCRRTFQEPVDCVVPLEAPPLMVRG